VPSQNRRFIPWIFILCSFNLSAKFIEGPNDYKVSLKEAKAKLKELKNMSNPGSVDSNRIPVKLGGSSNREEWLTEDIKELCHQDEHDFQKIQRSVLIPLTRAIKKQNIGDFKKQLVSTAFYSTPWEINKSPDKQFDAIMKFSWKQGHPRKDNFREIEMYLKSFNEIEDAEIVVKNFKSTQAQRDNQMKMKAIALNAYLDIRGVDKSGVRRHDRGPIRIKLVRSQGSWKIETLEQNGLNTLTLAKPRFEEITVDSGLGTLPSYKRLEAIRRGGYSLSTGDYNTDGVADLYIGAHGEGRLLEGLGNGKFKEVQDSGLEGERLVKTSIFADFNNNGLDDLLLVRFIPTKKGAEKNDLVLYENKGGKFEKATHIKDEQATYQAMPAAVADFDKDGFLDFYVGYPGAKDFTTLDPLDYVEGTKPEGLYSNLGNLKFKDSSAEAFESKKTSQLQRLYPHSALSADINHDGNMDILVIDDQGGLSPAYINKGNGKFIESAKQIGVVNEGYGMGAAVGDANNDGLIDAVLTNVNFHAFERLDASCRINWDQKIFTGMDTQGLRFYQAMKPGEFVETTKIVGLENVGEGLAGVEFLDYNNDGHQDLYVANGLWSGTDRTQDMSVMFSKIALKAEKMDYVLAKNSAQNIETQSDVMDILSGFKGDLFNEQEGLTARPHLAGHQRNRMFRNNGDGSFTEVGYLEGVDSLADGYVLAKADLTGNGNLDIILRNGDPGSVEANFSPVQIFKNNHERTNSLRLKLTGSRSNRDAIGAQVTIKTHSGLQYQQLIGNNGTAQSEKILHFGLGTNEKALSVQVLWPSGNTSTYNDLPSGRHNLKEPEKKLSSL
jgi:hypothetical protein